MANSFLEDRETPEYDSLMSLADQIVIRLPGCDNEMIRKFISSVYSDFVKRACVFRTLREIEVTHETSEYHICSRNIDCEVDVVIGVYCDGRRVNESKYVYSHGVLTLHPHLLPNKGKSVVMSVECLEVPRMGTSRAPLMFVRRYGDAIVSGVLWRLMAMSGKPWSDPTQAAMEAVVYENALTQERMRYHGDGVGGANYFKKGLVL